MSAAQIAFATNRAPAALLLMGAIAAAVMLMYAQTIVGIVELWQQSEYRHGALVLPISAYLLWRERWSLARSRLAPWWPGLVPLAGLVVVWWLSTLLDVQVLEQLAVILLISAAICTALGKNLFKRALFPLLFLIAAVPMGDSLLPYLMLITADISTALLRLTAVPVFREGQFLSLPGGNFEVADVCAGLNYLVSGLMIAALFAYLTYRSNLKRFVFIGATIVALIFANGFRAFVVMYVASASNLKYLAGRDHVWFGWMLFGLVIIGLFLLAARWADREDSSDPADQRSAQQSSVRDALPLVLVLALVLLAASAQRFQADFGSSWKLLLPAGAALLWVLFNGFRHPARASATPGSLKAESYGTPRATAIVGAAALLLAVGPALSPKPTTAAPAEMRSFRFPSVVGCSMESAPVMPQWQQGSPKPDFGGAAAYACAEPMRVMVAGFWDTGSNVEIHHLVPYGWRNTPTARRSLSRSDGQTLVVNELQFNDRLVWYWYRVGERTTASSSVAKLFLALGALSSSAPSSAVYLLEAIPRSAGLEQDGLSGIATALAESHLPPRSSAREHEMLAVPTSAKDVPAERE